MIRVLVTITLPIMRFCSLLIRVCLKWMHSNWVESLPARRTIAKSSYAGSTSFEHTLFNFVLLPGQAAATTARAGFTSTIWGSFHKPKVILAI